MFGGGRKAEFETVIVIKGDGKGGVKAVQANKAELDKLNNAQEQGVKTTEKYGRAQKNAEKDAEGFGKTVKAGGVMVVQAVAATVGAISALVGMNTKLLQETDRTAARLGVGTQAFMAQSEMARAAGLAQQDYADILKDVNVRVQEFATLGTGEAAEFFEHMNLDVADFKNLAPDQLLKRIGQELEGLNRQERILFLDKLGSDKAVALVDVITRLDEMEGRAIAVGAALSDIDAAEVAAAAQGMDDIGMVGRGAANQLTAELAPIISDISERIVQAAEDMGGFGSISGDVVDAMIAGLGLGLDVLHELHKVLKIIQVGWIGIGSVAADALASQAEGTAFLINSALQPFLHTLGAIAEGWGAILFGFSRLPTGFSDELLAGSDALAAFSRNMKVITIDAADITAMSDSMQASLVKSQAELDALLAQAPPSEKLTQWLADVRAKSEEVAQATVEARSAQSELTEENDRATSQVRELIEQMEFENRILGLTTVEQKVQTNLRKLDASATDEQREAVRRLTVERHNEEEAMKRADEQAKASIETRKNQIENTQKAIGEIVYNTLSDSGQDWDDYFDNILDGYKRVYAEFVGKNLTDALFNGGSTNLADILGLSKLAGGGAGSQGALGGIGFEALAKIPGFESFMKNSGASDIKKALDSIGATDDAGVSAFNKDALISGLKEMGLSIGASWAGGKVGSAMGESLFGKEAESNIAESIGSAIGTAVGGPLGAAIGSWLGSMVDVAAGGDGKVRQNAGFLAAPTPGADPDYTFDVDPFASGLKVTGFARRAEREAAMDVIETFRDVEGVFVALIEELGGALDMAGKSLNGLDQEATPGSSGTLFGFGGNGSLGGDLHAQLNSFIDQLGDNVTGLSDELLIAVRAASSAEEKISILSTAVVDQARASEEAARAAELQEDANERLLRAEEDLQAMRLDAVNALITATRNALALQRSIRDQSFALQGIAVIGSGLTGTIDDQIQHIQDMRELAEANHQQQLAMEQELFERRRALTQSLTQYATGLQLGDKSNLSAQAKLVLAESEFMGLAGRANNASLSTEQRLAAAEALQGAGDVYLDAARSMFASSSRYKAIFDNVLNVITGVVQAVDPGAEYDPAAANDALVSQLNSLQSQLSSVIGSGNARIVSELMTINGSISDLSPDMAAAITTTMGAYITQMIAAGKYSQVIADSIPKGSLAESGANKYREGLGLGPIAGDRSARNDDYSAAEIAAYVDGVRASAGSEEELIRQVYEAAKSAGVGSAQLAQATGISQQDIIDAAVKAGYGSFAGGGIASGPKSGHINILHDTEAVIPIPNGFVPVQIQGGAQRELVDQVRSLATQNARMADEIVKLRVQMVEIAQHASVQRINAESKLESIGVKLDSRRAIHGSDRFAKRS